MASKATSNQKKNPAGIILKLVKDLALELRSTGGDFSHINLDSSLEKDLGFDSLARVELLARIGQAFGVNLPERALVECETVRDFLRYVYAAENGITAPLEREKVLRETTPEGEIQLAGVEAADTLIDVLAYHLRYHPTRTHIIFLDENDHSVELTYEELWHGSLSVAASLRNLEVAPGRSVAIMLPTGLEYFCCFMGTLLCGAVPVPLYPPVRASQIEEHLARHTTILQNCLADVLVTFKEVRALAQLLRVGVEGVRKVVSVEDLFDSAGDFTPWQPVKGETAFIQYTSGSTGNPKGVVLTHANLLANIRAMGRTVGAGPSDVFVSWLPLYHDMGLIGAWLGSLYYGSRLVLMSPLSFLVKPERWLWTIHRYGGTLSAAPNFGYELCLKRIDERDLSGLDLASWRMAFNGAEPVSPETVRNFPRKFAQYGFRPDAMTPVYGLAESSVGLIFPPYNRKPLVDAINRDIFMRSGEVVPASGGDQTALRFVGSGQVLPGHKIRIVDREGKDLGDGKEGRLLFQGPSSTSGYFRNSEITAELFRGDWLDTGDLAYMRDGEVFITGRIKDIIIKGGRNIYPQELEEAVGVIPGIRKGCCVVFGGKSGSGSEKLIIVAETRERDPGKIEELKIAVNQRTMDILGMAADEILLESPGTVLKTSSGKIRRSAMKKLHEQGRIGGAKRAVWWQVIRILAAGAGPLIRRVMGEVARLAYAGYAWLVFGLLTLVAVPTALSTRGAVRYQLLRKLARFLFALSATPLRVEGLEHVPEDRSVIFVANHMSYLDGFALIAGLPGRIHFVAKAELRRNPLVRIMLNAIEVEYVERFDVEAGISDVERLTMLAGHGQSLLFFAEGTLHRLPGLLPFHMGAFMAATETGSEVVPVIIKGTRDKMCSGSWRPLPGAVRVIVEHPVRAKGTEWSAAVELRDLVRGRILQHVGEPDLGNVRAPVLNIIRRGEIDEANQG